MKRLIIVFLTVLIATSNLGIAVAKIEGASNDIETSESSGDNQKIEGEGFPDGFITGLISMIGYPMVFITSAIKMDFSLLRGYFIRNWVNHSGPFIFGNVLGLLIGWIIVVGIGAALNSNKGRTNKSSGRKKSRR
ncbi:hypothetical protein [Desulfosarcina ovata]|uniref:Uncharacterized protein n=1 Tax=Desulfosarcina ovata subsp. ovata TaxID=2752305 RepID=A0A5K8A3E7_9BACT|nr:hypothetical protein [Desulfosarcina ovata]BBO87042.1 hypothetical protein DSCOOX_02220 [Desulfosarcina ovata subsp. ovata]